MEERCRGAESVTENCKKQREVKETTAMNKKEGERERERGGC